MLIGAAAAGGAIAQLAAAPGQARTTDLAGLKKEAEVACLYHCDFGDPPRFVQMIQNISNHYSVYGNPLDLQLAIVAHGQGVKFFLETLDGTSWKDEAMVPQIFPRVSDVAKSGLKVFLCEITFKRLNIDPAKARKDAFISFVPSGVAAVAALQSKGFGYMKIG
ncbi:MAG: DsrE family protein [Beijerinckiaceae bacterium]